jgi:hypothetical protein
VRCIVQLIVRLCYTYKAGVQVSPNLLKTGVYSNLSLTDGFVSVAPHLNPPPHPHPLPGSITNKLCIPNESHSVWGRNFGGRRGGGGGRGCGGGGAEPRVTRGGVTHTRIPGLYRNYAAREGAPHISILPEVRSSAAPNSDVNSLCHTSYIHPWTA